MHRRSVSVWNTAVISSQLLGWVKTRSPTVQPLHPVLHLVHLEFHALASRCLNMSTRDAAALVGIL